MTRVNLLNSFIRENWDMYDNFTQRRQAAERVFSGAMNEIFKAHLHEANTTGTGAHSNESASAHDGERSQESIN